MAAPIDTISKARPTNVDADSQTRLSALAAAKLWRPSASGGLRSAWKSDPHGAAWAKWRKLLSGRSLPKALLASGKRRPHALEWGVDQTLSGWQAWRGQLLTLLASGDADNLAQFVQQWEERADSREPDPTFALECLTWASELPAVAQLLSSETWWRLLEQLTEIALQTHDVSLGDEPTADLAFALQALGGELPLTLGRLLPELQPLRKLRRPSASVLTEGVLALTDGEGLTTARVLTRQPLIMACWTRCRAWAEKTGKSCWSGDAETQYEWLVRQALRLSRSDASLALTDSYAGAGAMLRLAIDLAGDVSDNAASAERFGDKTHRQVAGKADAPEPSVNSEWSGIAVLAADWAPRSQRAVVTYDNSHSLLEYAASGKTILSGEWAVEVTVDGRTLAPVGEWEEQCWYSDDDCDYLELTLELEQGAKIDRQLLVARDDKIAYLADLVLTGSQKDSEIVVTTRLPLAHGVAFQPEEESRDGWLTQSGKPTVGVLPGALAEWRTDPRFGELTEEDGCLVLRQPWTGRNLCCPLLLDAAPSRFKKQRTWRQLAVAETLKNVSPDVAVGYRFQSGKDQWIAYRSLDKQANRTLLGHNLSSEAFFGRFLKSGEVDEFFEIEDD